MILQDGETYRIEIIYGPYKGLICEAVYYHGYRWFEVGNPDVTVLSNCVEILGESLENIQERDLVNIAETGQSYNLIDLAKHQYFKDGSWRDVPAGKSLYQLALDGLQVRKKINA